MKRLKNKKNDIPYEQRLKQYEQEKQDLLFDPNFTQAKYEIEIKRLAKKYDI